MIAFEINKGQAHFVTDKHVFYSSSNHDISIHGLENRISGASNILTITNSPAMSNLVCHVPLTVYADSTIDFGSSLVPWKRIILSSNVLNIGDGAILYDKTVKTARTNKTMNLENFRDHVFSNRTSAMGSDPLRYLIPPGVLVAYGGLVDATVSNNDFQIRGYLPCDGRACSRSTFSRLFSIVGVTYGNGDGVSTFNIPNLGSRSPLGTAGNGVGIGTVSGGSHEHTLVFNTTMPQHSHTVAFAPGNDINVAPGGFGLVRRSDAPRCVAAGTDTYTWDLRIAPTGSGYSTSFEGNSSGADPFSILHPYIIVNFLIKT